MTRGIPVIAANRGSLPEVVGKAGYLFDPAEPEALAHALRAVLTDPQRRAAMREEGWRQAGHFRWRDTADRMREAWQLALERRRARRG
jgi:glycosyltransferase involved in cell wall biosynthesis